MMYSVNKKDCNTCPLCGCPINWEVCFSEEECYYAYCPSCQHEFFAHQFNGFLVEDRGD